MLSLERIYRHHLYKKHRNRKGTRKTGHTIFHEVSPLRLVRRNIAGGDQPAVATDKVSSGVIFFEIVGMTRMTVDFWLIQRGLDLDFGVVVCHETDAHPQLNNPDDKND